MKKIIITSTLLTATFISQAQDHFDPLQDRQFVFDAFNICATLLVFYLITSFILKLVKQRLDYRLKHKMIEKDAPQNVVAAIMHDEKKDNGNAVLQWVFVLAGIGVGFTIIYLSRPFGAHSLAIMAFCIAAVFLAYYLIVHKKANQLP